MGLRLKSEGRAALTGTLPRLGTLIRAVFKASAREFLQSSTPPLSSFKREGSWDTEIPALHSFIKCMYPTLTEPYLPSNASHFSLCPGFASSRAPFTAAGNQRNRLLRMTKQVSGTTQRSFLPGYVGRTRRKIGVEYKIGNHRR